jgi:hypothetical protein
LHHDEQIAYRQLGFANRSDGTACALQCFGSTSSIMGYFPCSTSALAYGLHDFLLQASAVWPSTVPSLPNSAMCWYAILTLLAESLLLLFQPAPVGHFPNMLAHGLAWAGALSFIVFVRTCAVLRKYETMEISAPEFGGR